jgi:hypothetical protein
MNAPDPENITNMSPFPKPVGSEKSHFNINIFFPRGQSPRPAILHFHSLLRLFQN